MKLLFLNSLKGLRNKKIQMLGIILLVTLSTGIYIAMNTALDRMEDSYYNYLNDQNVEYVAVDVNVDYTKDVSVNDLNYLLNNQLSNLTASELEAIDTYKCAIDSSCNLSTNPFKNNSFQYIISNIFKKYDADTYIQSKKLSTLTDKYNFKFQVTKSKSLQLEDNTYIKVIPYNTNNSINKPYLIEGSLPTNNKEITMLPKYAELHNIKIGDKYKVGDTEYTVVGFTYAPDYVYPLVSYSALIFDENKNNIIYVDNDDYTNISGVEEKVFSILYNNMDRKFKFDFNSDTSNGPFAILNDESNIASINPFTPTRLARIAALQLEFSTDRLFAEYFLYLLLGISVFVIAIITKKRIDDEKLQIGVLKSLGYSPFSIAVSYLVYPIIGALIGGILGYIIGASLNGLLANEYINYYLVPLAKFSINYKYLFNVLVIPTLLLSVLSYLIAILMLKKKPLNLLREGSNLKVNIFSKIANKLTSKLPFKYRFKYNLAFRSIPKLLVVAITSLFTGMLVVLTLIGSNLMQNLVDKSFDGMEYKYMVYNYTIETEEIDSESDYVMAASLPIVKVIDKNSNEKVLDKDVTISLEGIDTDSRYTKLLDLDNNNIINLLTDEDGIIINKNIQKLYDVNIGDTLILGINNDNSQTISYKVIGVTEQYMNVTGYVNRLGFCKKFGYSGPAYSMILSNNDQFSNLNKLDSAISNNIAAVINFSDMKSNITDSLQKYNASIYVVIGFASIIAFVIISVVANIVVEENKKIISLMKVMGYKNKRISSIVLNIYTPVIIIFYFLSIPIMIKILEKIVSVLSGDMGMTIPISLDPSLAIIGLICLLIAYYIAIGLSKKVLNKIPLAMALKRE